MCSVKTPKIEQPKDKEPTVVRSPYLDGVGPDARAMRKGRNSLRIDRGVPVSPGPPAAVLPPARGQPGRTPVVSGGGTRGGTTGLKLKRGLRAF